MKSRKNEAPPPPFVKETFSKPEPTVKVTQTIRESLPLDAIAGVASMPLDTQRNLLAKWEETVFSLHTQYVEAIAIRDALALHVKTDLMKPHWTRHAAVASLHGEGARLRPCAKCGKPTEWSFGDFPQCTFKDMIPTAPEHAVCFVDAGFKRNVTRHERDVAYILSGYASEPTQKSPTKKGKK